MFASLEAHAHACYFLMLHDLIDIVARRDGRRHRVRVQDGDMLVSSTGEMEGRGAAPCAGSDDEDGG